MVGVFSWNDVEGFFAFNFDFDLKLTFSQGHKIFSTLCHQRLPFRTQHRIITHRTITIELAEYLAEMM